MSGLSSERREELARALHKINGCHLDEDCAPDKFDYEDADAIAPLLAAEREAGAAAVRARVEALLEQLSASVPLRGSHQAWVYVDDLRAALNGGE